MAKLLPLLAVFALSLNLFGGVLVSTGAAGTLGINPAVGGDDKVDEAQSQAEGFESGAPTGSTLFGMYNVLGGVVSTLALPVTGLPNMLRRAGTPSAITGLLRNLLLVIYAMGVVSFLRNYNLND
jgi:hypothetical protein